MVITRMPLRLLAAERVKKKKDINAKQTTKHYSFFIIRTIHSINILHFIYILHVYI